MRITKQLFKKKKLNEYSTKRKWKLLTMLTTDSFT